jgi:hypothetical protein
MISGENTMGFFGDLLFGKRKKYTNELMHSNNPYVQAILLTKKELFNVYEKTSEVQFNATDEDNFSALLSLLIVTIGIILYNEKICGTPPEKAVEKYGNFKQLILDIKKIASSLNVKICLIARNKEEVEEIIPKLPAEMNANENSIISADRAFAILFELRSLRWLPELAQTECLVKIGRTLSLNEVASSVVEDMIFGKNKEKLRFLVRFGTSGAISSLIVTLSLGKF